MKEFAVSFLQHAVFCGLLFAWSGRIYAAAGDLDPSFNTTGHVVTRFPGPTLNESASAIAVQADGKTVVVGTADWQWAVTRLNTNGTLDTSFGFAGKLITDFTGSGGSPNAVAVQPDGKIIVAGAAVTNGNNQFAVVRYTTNGTLDGTFGTQGKAMFGFGVNSYRDYANGIAIQPDGKIVLAGPLSVASVDFCVTRLNADGTLDAGFGSGGHVTTDPSNGLYDEAYAVALQADGKIVVVGQSSAGPHDGMGVARYTTNGVLDASFASNGFTRIDYLNHSLMAQAVVIQPDGKILVGGRTLTTDISGVTGSFVLARLTTNGMPDLTFGDANGVLSRYLTGSSQNAAYGLVLQPDGKIVMSGSSDAYSHGTNDFVLWQFNPDGSTIRIVSYYSINRNVNEEAKAIAVRADGKIAAAGYSSLNADSDFAAFEVTTNLDFDPDFRPTTNGTIAIVGAFPSLSIVASANSGSTQPDGRILVIGSSGDYPVSRPCLARYLADGSLDAGGLFIMNDETNTSGVDVVAQPDGKPVLLAGRFYDPASTNTDPFLLRLMSDSTPDASFGNAGRTAISFGQSGVAASNSFKIVSHVALQPDGRMLVIGNILHNANNTADAALSRFNADGTVDVAFGSGGTLAYPGEKYGKQVAIQTDGKIVVATTTFTFRRLLTNGTPDLNFGTGGTFVAPVSAQLNDMLLLADGRILGVGGPSLPQYIQLVCLTTNGTLDTNFGNGGIATNNFGGIYLSGDALALQHDGKILVCGQIQKQAYIYNYLVVRYLPNGMLDSTFGSVGSISPSFGAQSTPRDIAVQRDGRIVIIGTLTEGNGGYNNWGVTRFLNDQANTPPSISSISDQTIFEDTSLAIPFTVSDWETPADQLIISAYSSNTNLIPANGLVFGGIMSSRTLTLIPATNSSGTATITVQANDGLVTATTSFQLTVTPVNLPHTLAQPSITAGHLFSLQLQGEAGKIYGIEASTDLVHWAQVLTVTNVTGSLSVDLDDVRTNVQRFFRARIP